MTTVIEFIRRFHVTRFVAAGVIGSIVGVVFVSIVWLLVQAFQFFI